MGILIGTLITAVLCAFTYRFGGCSKEEGRQKYPWAPKWVFKSWVRDFGCSLFSIFWVIIFYPQVPWYVYLISMGWCYGMITTYWDEVFKYDCFAFHGFMIGVSYLLLAWGSGMWMGYIVRSAFLGLSMGVLSALTGNVDKEELGRGALIGLTLPILLM